MGLEHRYNVDELDTGEEGAPTGQAVVEHDGLVAGGGLDQEQEAEQAGVGLGSGVNRNRVSIQVDVIAVCLKQKTGEPVCEVE